MQSYCIPLAEATDRTEVGGKGAGLGELVRFGERVPDGFVVTEAAGEAEILDAYARLGGGAVAVRSSATAEDRGDASFAGQHDSLLDVRGEAALVAAVETVRGSLHGERVEAYRADRGLAGGEVRMAVVVQRMVDAVETGVLFTADPVTGQREVMNAEADDLVALGTRVQRHFGVPQDIEWARDRDGTLWVLQARAITTLFPMPPATPDLRVYFEFGHVQGMLRPVTPMGMATLQRTVAEMVAALGLRAEIVDIGGRLYGDLTDFVRDARARKRLVRLMAVDFGPRAQRVMEHVLADPRFAPDGRRAPRPVFALGRAAVGVARALLWPGSARRRLFRAVEQIRTETDDPGTAGAITWPIVAGMVASAVPVPLLKGLAKPEEVREVLAGLPHNVTIEMDLALWRVAREAGPATTPEALARRHREGHLPALDAFLADYGHRGAAEADLGVPRWAEDPAPVYAALANLARISDPAEAPDARFERAATGAEAKLALLGRRLPWWSVRGRVAIWLLRRARELAGLREAGKFAGLYELRAERERLLGVGRELVAAGRLEAADDVMFLTSDELAAIPVDNQPNPSDPAATFTPTQCRGGGWWRGPENQDQKLTVAARRAVHRAESRRRHVPVALLSDGTDVEATLPGDGGTMRGVGASAGRARGPARVVHDPATAHIEPGEVLVTVTTDPGWTPLFLTAAALITETGAVMAHGPTVAREYGLPTVISVARATERITTGQMVEVDGATGSVTVL